MMDFFLKIRIYRAFSESKCKLQKKKKRKKKIEPFPTIFVPPNHHSQVISFIICVYVKEREIPQINVLS